MAASTPAPRNILRGHRAQIHAATFLRHDERLATGDADGYVVLWDLAIMRPRAVWRPHESAILGIRGWGHDRVITHGRDHKLIVWKIDEKDEQRLSIALPLEDVPTPRPQPWILHLLEVNTMNFCSFASCPAVPDVDYMAHPDATRLHIAVPNTLSSDAIDIYSLPSQARTHTVRPGKDTGMAMSLALLNREDSLTLIAAFENGFASVHRLQPSGQWTMTYRAQAHTQPILSLDVDPSQGYFLTSSADAILAKHPIPVAQQEVISEFDPENRIIEEIDDPPVPSGPSLLSAQLKGSPSQQSYQKTTTLKEWEHPSKTINTKHSGQQGLKIRSDGRIFATAGWDSKVRVYSCKTLKELAVLRWHTVGCYAVAFAGVNKPTLDDAAREESPVPNQQTGPKKATSLAPIGETRMSVKDRRIHQARTAHWIAAGAKDGKISLWDIY